MPANTCVFCPFHGDSRMALLLHCEAEHTLRVDDGGRSPPCSCGFSSVSWSSLKMHLWQFHGGGLQLRPEKCVQFRPDELRQLIALATISPAQQPQTTMSKAINGGVMSMGHHGGNGALSPEMPREQPMYRMQGYPSPRESFEAPLDPYRISPRHAEALEPFSRSERNGVDEPDTARRGEFVCSLCERKCNTRESLHRHKREMHPTNRCLVYTCRKCLCEFVIKRTARLHMKEHGIYGAYDAFSTVRNATRDELPLRHCQSAGCPFRTSQPSLVKHDTHRVKMFAKITDQEWQEIRKGRYANDSPPASASSSSSSPQDRANIRKIDCEVSDGHIRVPAEGKEGRYILVSADPDNESDDLLINIRHPKPTALASSSSMFSSLLDGMNESGLKEIEMLLEQRHQRRSHKF